MSDTLDERVVKIEFDNSKFEKNVKQTQKSLEQLDEQLAFKNGSDGIERIEASFSHFQAVAFTIINRITNRVIDLGINLVKSLSVDNISSGWDKFGEKTVSVATMSAQKIKMAGKTLEDYDEKMEAINDQLDKLNWFTDETSYNFTDMVNNIGKFTAAGRSLDESVSAMMGIANWAALSGQNAATASRAMYQLSQALGKGYVQLIDWRSIQNANMDTEEFRERVLEAAVAVGELTKEGEKFITKTGKKFSLSEFTESLSSKWLTNDVLLNVLGEYSSAVEKLYNICEEEGITAPEAIEKYGDKLDKFGLKAFKAAQEARTFSDVIASVKDAVSTGWMNTAEKIFGGYDESKVLWTELANQLYDVFAEGGNFRNEVLGLWRDLGGNKNIFGTHGSSNQGAFWNIYDSIIAVRNLIKEAWSDVFNVSSFSEYTERAQDIAEKLNNLTNRIREFTKRIKDSLENNVRLKFIFQGLFNVLKIGIQVIMGIRYAIDPIISLAKDLAKFLFDKIAGFGMNLSKVQNTAIAIENVSRKISDILSTIIESIDIVGILDKITKAVSKLFGVIAKMRPLEKLKNIIVTLLNAFKSGTGGISGFFKALSTGIKDVATYIGTGVSTVDTEKLLNPVVAMFNGIASFVKGLLAIVRPLTTMLGQALNLVGVVMRNFGELLSGLISVFNDKEASKIIKISLIASLLLAPIIILAVVITRLIRTIGYLVSPIANLSQALSDALYTISNSFMVKSMSQMLKAIALIVMSMTAMIMVVANIPVKGLLIALGVLNFVVLFIGALVAFLFILTKNDSKFKDILKQKANIGSLVALSMIFHSISEMLLAIAGSLKIISTISNGKFLKSVTSLLVILTALFSMVVGFDKLLKTEIDYKKVEKLMKAISSCILSLSVALYIVGKINPENTTGSVAALLALMIGLHSLVVGINNLTKTELDYRRVGKLIKSLSLSLIGMSIAIKIISTVKDADMVRESVMSMIFLMAGVSLFLFALKKVLAVGIDYGSVASFMVGLSLSLILIANAIRIVGSIKDTANTWTAVGALVAILAAFTTIIVIVNQMGAGIGFKTLGIVFGLIGLALALVSLSGALALFSKSLKAIGDIDWLAFAKLATGLMVISVFAEQSFLDEAKIFAFGVALATLGAGLVTFSAGMQMLEAVDWTTIGKLALALATIGVLIDAGIFKKAGLVNAARMILLSIGLTALGLSLLTLGGAVNVFARSLRILNDVGWQAVGILASSLVALVAVGAYASKSALKLIALGFALVPLSAGVALLAFSMQELEDVSWDSLWKAMVMLSASIALLSTSVRFFIVNYPNRVALFAISIALSALAASAIVFALAMKQMEGVSWTAIGQSLAFIAAGIILLSAAVKFFVSSYQDMAGILVVSASLSAMAASLMIFALAMKQMEGVSWTTVWQSIVLLASSMVLLIAAAKIMGPAIITVLALGAAVTLLGLGLFLAATSLQIFATALPEAATSIVSNIDVLSAALELIGPALINALMAAFKSLLDNLGDIMPSIFDLVSGILNGVLSVLNTVGPELIATVVNLILTLLGQLADHADELIESIGTILQAALDWLKNNVADIVGKLIDILLDVIRTLTSRIGEIIQELCTFLIALINALFDGIGPVLKTLLDRTMEFLKEFIPLFIKDLLTFVHILTDAVLLLIADIIKLTIATLGTLGKLMLDLLAGIILLIVQVSVGLTKVLFEAFRTILYNAFDVLSQVLIFMATDIPKLIGGALGRLLGAIIEFIGDLINDNLGGLFGFGDWLKGIGKGMSDAANKAFDEDLLKGKNVIAALNTARNNIDGTIKDITSNVTEDVNQGVEEINGALQSSLATLANMTSAYQVGENVGKGMAEGIEDSKDDAGTSAEDAAKFVTEAAKEELGEHSPSKVFAEIGSYMMQGLALGIGEESVTARQAAIDAINDTISTVKDAVASDVSDDIVIRPVLDLSDVSRGAQSISSIMSNVSRGRISVGGALADSIQRRTNANKVTEPSENQNGGTTVVNNETYSPVFNITSNDPEGVAREVDIRLQRMRAQSNLAKGGAK